MSGSTEMIIPETLGTEMEALVQRYAKAGGLGVQLLNAIGSQAADLLDKLPDTVRSRLNVATEKALEASFAAAERSRGRYFPDAPDWVTQVTATGLGALGGTGGLPTALAELPVTTTLLLRAIQSSAVSHGFDPKDDEIRKACLLVFTAAGPLEHDDGANSAFFAARTALTGATVQSVLKTVAPRLATILGQKLAAQTVPVLGAAAGAATNYTYSSYYKDMATVHFGLKRLALRHSLEEYRVTEAFKHLSSQV
ncbi:MAG: EcsC family protein [Marinovum sp.]|nr:EcsC family protein [Marinovum sp.]